MKTKSDSGLVVSYRNSIKSRVKQEYIENRMLKVQPRIKRKYVATIFCCHFELEPPIIADSKYGWR